MYSFREKLARFMAGRYGIDTLYTVLLAVCVILAIVNMFVRSWIIWILMLAVSAGR